MNIIPRSLAFDMLFWHNSGDAHDVLDKIYDSFKSRIAELEALQEENVKLQDRLQTESYLKAISVTETLLEPKRCESCSAYGKNYRMGYDHNYCVNLRTFVSPLFGCINHEKEQQ